MFTKFVHHVWTTFLRSSSQSHIAFRPYSSHLGLGLLALLVSLSLWVLITMEQNPPKTDTFPQSIPVKPVNVPPNLDLLGEIQPVRVRITAPLYAWNRLGMNDFKATVDLSRASAGTQEVPVHAESGIRRVDILEVIPAKVAVRLETLSRQTVPVKVNIVDNPPFGYVAEKYEVTPKQVTVIGPEQLVNQVDAAVANVDLSGMKITVNQSFTLSPRTVRGYEILGVTLEPSSVVVEVPIKQQLHHLNFIVNPTLEGSVPPGYWITDTSVDPPNVSVVGALEVLQEMEYLRTLPVDIEGITQTVTQTVDIDLPEGVDLIGVKKVTVRATVIPRKGSQIFRVAPQFTGMVYGTHVVADTDSVDITLYGDMPVLINLEPTEIRVIVDLSNLVRGFYLLEPKIVVFQPLEVLDFRPKQIGVNIR